MTRPFRMMEVRWPLWRGSCATVCTEITKIRSHKDSLDLVIFVNRVSKDPIASARPALTFVSN